MSFCGLRFFPGFGSESGWPKNTWSYRDPDPQHRIDRIYYRHKGSSIVVQSLVLLLQNTAFIRAYVGFTTVELPYRERFRQRCQQGRLFLLVIKFLHIKSWGLSNFYIYDSHQKLGKLSSLFVYLNLCGYIFQVGHWSTWLWSNICIYFNVLIYTVIWQKQWEGLGHYYNSYK